MNVCDVLPTSDCLGHPSMRKSDGLKPSMEHSKTRPALGAWAHECALTTRCLPLENKVVDTNWSSSHTPHLQEHWKRSADLSWCRRDLFLIFLWWKLKIFLKEERRVKYYTEIIPSGSSLSTYILQNVGSEKKKKKLDKIMSIPKSHSLLLEKEYLP